MSNFTDIKMEYKDKKGFFDISITDNGDLEQDQSFDTSLNCAILTDGRADNTEVNEIEKQRGTIVDLFTNNNNGSKLWLLEQARADLNTKNRSTDYVKNALKFLVEEKFCKNISVSSKLTVDGIILMITIERLNGVFDNYNYNAWEKSIYKV